MRIIKAGFGYPYYLYVPPEVRNDPDKKKIHTILVLPNNTGKLNDHFAVHESDVKRRMSSINAIAPVLKVAVLMPVFPRPASDWQTYTHALHRDSMVTTKSELRRFDLQLIAMNDNARAPKRVREQLIEPLCVAAMNTPADQASATVFLRVLGDALFGTAGGSDLLLPRVGLSELFPRPAAAWLSAQGARIELRRRIAELLPDGGGWRVDGERFDALLLACSAIEAARLVRPLAPGWAEQAEALRYEPIATVYLDRSPRPIPLPMLALHAGEGNPAQFVFDLDALGVCSGRLAFVVSGAGPWLAARRRGTQGGGR